MSQKYLLFLRYLADDIDILGSESERGVHRYILQTISKLIFQFFVTKKFKKKRSEALVLERRAGSNILLNVGFFL